MSIKLADKLQKILNDKYGRRYRSPGELDDVLDAVTRDMKRVKAQDVVRHEVPFKGMLKGKPVDGTVEIVFGHYDNVWVAFCFYADGWANAMRPLTEDTEDMQWLDDFVVKKLMG